MRISSCWCALLLPLAGCSPRLAKGEATTPPRLLGCDGQPPLRSTGYPLGVNLELVVDSTGRVDPGTIVDRTERPMRPGHGYDTTNFHPIPADAVQKARLIAATCRFTPARRGDQALAYRTTVMITIEGVFPPGLDE